jgi:hypothetical protein
MELDTHQSEINDVTQKPKPYYIIINPEDDVLRPKHDVLKTVS